MNDPDIQTVKMDFTFAGNSRVIFVIVWDKHY